MDTKVDLDTVYNEFIGQLEENVRNEVEYPVEDLAPVMLGIINDAMEMSARMADYMALIQQLDREQFFLVDHFSDVNDRIQEDLSTIHEMALAWDEMLFIEVD